MDRTQVEPPHHPTLILTMFLHAFTHGLGTLLIPLYLLMKQDLGRPGVKSITLIVSLYLTVYFLFSYPAGMLADRFNRKRLLGIGLLGNALAIILMGYTRNYQLLLLLAIVAGLFGTLFHPSANALIPAHYPGNPGMALGIIGIGSGLGFFTGAQYSGWRAATVNPAHLPWHAHSPWQVPCIEFGLFGIGMAVIYLLFAREVRHEHHQRIARPLGIGMRRRILALSAVLGLRDFSGVATSSLVSIYLQRACGYDTRSAGFVLGAMMLISMVANPLAVALSAGPRRLIVLAGCLVGAGLLLFACPYVSVAMLLPLLAIFQCFHLGSYAVGETAIIERVDPNSRGRVIGLFLTFAGTLASTSPWVMGLWTDLLGQRAFRSQGYVIPFTVLGLMMMAASFSVPLIARLGRQTLSPAFPILALLEPEGA
jgi:MFS family permease